MPRRSERNSTVCLASCWMRSSCDAMYRSRVAGLGHCNALVVYDTATLPPRLAKDGGRCGRIANSRVQYERP
eukprot:13056383-Ditylum_brightwellii.AAC.1